MIFLSGLICCLIKYKAKVNKNIAVKSIHIMNTSIVELYKFFLATENFKTPLLTLTYTITLFLINLVSKE